MQFGDHGLARLRIHRGGLPLGRLRPLDLEADQVRLDVAEQILDALDLGADRLDLGRVLGRPGLDLLLGQDGRGEWGLVLLGADPDLQLTPLEAHRRKVPDLAATVELAIERLDHLFGGGAFGKQFS